MKGAEEMLKNFKIRNKLFLGFGLVIIILFVLSVVSYNNINQLHEANQWDRHTYEVLLELQGIRESMINMETGQRGFAITGVDEFLEPYLIIDPQTDSTINIKSGDTVFIFHHQPMIVNQLIRAFSDPQKYFKITDQTQELSFPNNLQIVTLTEYNF